MVPVSAQVITESQRETRTASLNASTNSLTFNASKTVTQIAISTRPGGFRCYDVVGGRREQSAWRAGR